MKRLVMPFAAFVLIAGSLLFNDAFESSAQRAAVANGPARNAAIVAATAAVLQETSELRELPIIRPVKSGAQSRADIERMLIKKLNEQMTRAEMHATEVSLRKFGLVPEGFEYRPFIIKLLTEQVAGYYDARAREFYLADWLDLEGQKPVMAHELTHALQDQHFNLQRFERWTDGDSDAKLAAHALIEGDATLAMTLYMAKNPLVALAFSRSLSALGSSSKQFNESPRALRDTLIFPYFQGMEWATAVYKKGGWKMVSDAYTKLPQSSEQILHPEKYFAYEPPVKITIPDLTEVLNKSQGKQVAGGSKRESGGRRQAAGDSNQQPPVGLLGELSFGFANPQDAGPQSATRKSQSRRQRGVQIPIPGTRPAPETRNLAPYLWRRIDDDVNGEWSYFLILDQFLNAASESKRASAGWAGDRYTIYEKPSTGQVLLVQVSQWDTENDAEEFFKAYVKRTALRYPGMAPLQENLRNQNIRRWRMRDGDVVIELRGSRVIMLEGMPSSVSENILMKLIG
jgi:hypothetical protein